MLHWFAFVRRDTSKHVMEQNKRNKAKQNCVVEINDSSRLHILADRCHCIQNNKVFPTMRGD